MTLVGPTGDTHVADGGPGTLSHIEMQLRAIAPYRFELEARTGVLRITVGNRAHKSDMEQLLEMHGVNFIPMAVRTEVVVSGNAADTEKVWNIDVINGVSHVEFLAGSHIDQVVSELMTLARQSNMPATTSFNGQQITIGPDKYKMKAEGYQPPKTRRRINIGDE